MPLAEAVRSPRALGLDGQPITHARALGICLGDSPT
jgi:hypothetical protein